MEPESNNMPSSGFAKELNILDYLLVIFRRRWTMLIMVAVVTGIATIASLRMPKMYSAGCKIEINQQMQSMPIGMDYRFFNPNFLNTEIALIKSRSLNYEVANELGLAYEVTDVSGGLSNAIKYLEIKEGTQKGALVVKFLSANEYRVVYNDENIGKGMIGDEFEGPFGTMLITTNKGKKGKQIIVELRDIDLEVSKIIQSIEVTQVRSVNMVDLTVRGRDPETIKDIANTLAELYVYRSLDDKRLQASSTRRFIEKQLERIKINLDAAGEDLMDFKREEGIIDIDMETARRVATLTSLENKILESSIERQRKAREIAELKYRAAELQPTETSELHIYSPDFSYFNEDSKIASIEDRIFRLENDRAELLVSHKESHPEVKQIDTEIARLNQQLSEELDLIIVNGRLATEINLADKNMADLNATFLDYQQHLQNIPEKELELNRLIRKYQVNEKIYYSLMEKLQEYQIRESMESADIRIIDNAIIPRSPYSPNHLKNIGIGFALGLFLGLTLIFILEFADATVNTVEDLEKMFTTPVIGIIPEPQQLKSGNISRSQNGNKWDSYSLSFDRPKSPISEAFRSLRTGIFASFVDSPQFSLVITSSSLSEGKSNTVANLAIVFAQIGKKVVLIDADLRRSILHKALGLNKSPGLSEYLLGLSPLSKCVQETKQENLFVITGGDHPPNPSELLASKKFDKLIGNLHKKYDVILFDAPPILAVTDAMILGSLTDGLLFIVSAGKTDRGAAKRAYQAINQVQIKIIGIVLNRVKADRSLGHYGYKYYSQYYRDYYEEET